MNCSDQVCLAGMYVDDCLEKVGRVQLNLVEYDTVLSREMQAALNELKEAWQDYKELTK